MAIEQYIWGSAGSSTLAAVDATVNYSHVMGSLAWTDTEVNARQLVPTGGVLGHLNVFVSVAPGTGDSWTFCLVKNGTADTSTNVVITGANKSGSSSGTISLIATDKVSLRVTVSGTPEASSYCHWYVDWAPTISGETIFMCGTSDALNPAANEYNNFYGGLTFHTTSGYRMMPCPTAGTWKKLYIELSSAPDDTTDGYNFYLQKNGTVTGVSVTLTGSTTTGNDQDTNACVAGDRVAMLITRTATNPSYSPYAYWGIVFVPDTTYEFIITMNMTDILSTTATEYQSIIGNRGYSATEANHSFYCPAITIKNLYVRLGSDPGTSPDAYTIGFRDDGATVLSTTIVADDVVGSDTDSVTITAGSLVNYIQIPVDTPTVSVAMAASVCGIITPP